ncbi:MAG: DNA gyrase/topoisomerase IV subunit A [Bacteroidales bacterium]|nr:DNA gyrase/topoisomerase IV subunit A [Bacteroidales bacterium]
MSTDEDNRIEEEDGALPPEAGIFELEDGADDHLIETGHVTELTGMYKDWFLDYASYVILERAVPHVGDGLKPVQRRILHAMRQLEDGRYNKVANIIGYTMQFHPHGDASIGEALVQLGQKDLLIDTQGNWGNILTGDGAAAPRYIEARLSRFALEVIFNPKITVWKSSYDGRNQEPLTLPVKFPLLLALGVEGIAVGLASKILPHNFNELIDACIATLQEKSFELYPDFATGGLIDVSRYNEGLRGGIVRIRARISRLDKKTLVITEIPFGQNTSTLIDSILKANEKGKIKIRKIDDNTSGNVEILIHLVPGIDPDKTIDALYAFTDCEIPVSPNACVIQEGRPVFMGVSEILRNSTRETVKLLTRELQIRLEELEDMWHFSSLEKIFIENELYEPIKACKTEEAILQTIDKELKPYHKLLRKQVTHEDCIRLSNIPIKRISKYSAFKADEQIRQTEAEIDEVNNHLNNIIPFSINYFKQIRKKYGAGRERKTEIRNFDTIEATKVVVANEKLYVNRAEGFVGTGLKKDEYVCDCSDIDDIIIIFRDGRYKITKVAEKQFVGKDIEYVNVFKKNDDRTIYNLVYRDGKSGVVYMKRCSVSGLTRDKDYDLTQGNTGSKILYLSVNPNGEAEILKITLKPRPRLKNLVLEIALGQLAIKGKSSIGNIVTRYPVNKVELKEKGVSTLSAKKIWWNETVMRLNDDGRGTYLGEFSGHDKLIVFTRSGLMRLSSFDLSNHFEDDLLMLHKFVPEKIYSAVYYDSKQKYYYVKRFAAEPSEKPSLFIDEHPKSYLVLLSGQNHPRVEIRFGGKHKNRKNEVIDLSEYIAVKGYKAKGKRLTHYEVKEIVELEPLNFEPITAEPDAEQENQPVEEIQHEPEIKQTAEKPEKSGERVRAEKPARSKGSIEPKEPVKPEKLARSKEPVKPEAPAKSKESVKPETPAKPEGRVTTEVKTKSETEKKSGGSLKSRVKGKSEKKGKSKRSDDEGQMSLF